MDCGGSCDPCESCDDGIQNQGEKGIDCGGPCKQCPVKASCSDGIRNQGESGVDCGGPCSPCVTEPTRASTTRAVSTTLAAATTTLPEGKPVAVDYCSFDLTHCGDGVRNCGETGVDCGGSCGQCSQVGIIGRAIQFASQRGGWISTLMLLLLIFAYVSYRLVVFLIGKKRRSGDKDGVHPKTVTVARRRRKA